MLMEKEQKRRSIREINASMDEIIKRKPTQKQIEELAEVIRKINEGNEAYDSIIDSNQKIAKSDESFMTE
jgi:hypothetical protein